MLCRQGRFLLVPAQAQLRPGEWAWSCSSPSGGDLQLIDVELVYKGGCRGCLHAGIWGHLGAVESARWDLGSFTQWTSARCDFVSHLKLITWFFFFFFL